MNMNINDSIPTVVIRHIHLVTYITEMKLTFFILVRSQSTSVEAKPTPYHTLSWLGPPCATRTHKNTFSRLGLDEEYAKEVI